MEPVNTTTHWKINRRMMRALSQLHTLYPMVFETTLVNSTKKKNMIEFVDEIRAKFPGQTHIVAFNLQTGDIPILDMKELFDALHWSSCGRWTVTKKEDGNKLVVKGTVCGCVCHATFDLHPGEPNCLKGLLLADVYVYGGFPNFVFGLGSYREAVNFLRIIMDEANKPSAAAH